MSCHFNYQYINREEDKKEAELVTNKLYDYIKTRDFEGSTQLFSAKFYKVTSRSKLLRILEGTNDKLGTLLETNLENWETLIVKGSNRIATYRFYYKNRYSNFDTEERITMSKEEDGQIRVIEYNINSDGFIPLDGATAANNIHNPRLVSCKIDSLLGLPLPEMQWISSAAKSNYATWK